MAKRDGDLYDVAKRIDMQPAAFLVPGADEPSGNLNLENLPKTSLREALSRLGSMCFHPLITISHLFPHLLSSSCWCLTHTWRGDGQCV